MRTISTLATLVALIPLAGCGRGQVAAPWSGFDGDPRARPGEINSGAAYGVSIGMDHKKALATLGDRDHLQRSAAFCLAPAANEGGKLDLDTAADSVDYKTAGQSFVLQCKDTLQEIWYSWPTFGGLPIFGEVEVIDVNYKGGRVSKIEWHGGGNIIG